MSPAFSITLSTPHFPSSPHFLPLDNVHFHCEVKSKVSPKQSTDGRSAAQRRKPPWQERAGKNALARTRWQERPGKNAAHLVFRVLDGCLRGRCPSRTDAVQPAQPDAVGESSRHGAVHRLGRPDRRALAYEGADPQARQILQHRAGRLPPARSPLQPQGTQTAAMIASRRRWPAPHFLVQ